MSILPFKGERRWGVSKMVALVSCALATTTLVMGRPAAAAEKVVFTYGGFGQSLTVNELKTFAETGRASSKLRFFLRVSGQDPEQARRFLTQEAKVSLKLADRILHTIPGEYVLFQTGQVLHTPARRANIQALRSSIILSLSDDSEISFIEFLERYPTNDLTVDGLRLAKTARRVNRFIGRAEEDLEAPIAIATDLLETFVCECDTGVAGSSPQPASPQ